MAKFVAIGYGDRTGYDRAAPEVRNAAHAHDKDLQKRGVLMGVADGPVQVRNPDAAGVQTASSPFMSSPLPVAGFAVIEAVDLSDAIRMASQVPLSHTAS
jgi:hypothetical protein